MSWQVFLLALWLLLLPLNVGELGLPLLGVARVGLGVVLLGLGLIDLVFARTGESHPSILMKVFALHAGVLTAATVLSGQRMETWVAVVTLWLPLVVVASRRIFGPAILLAALYVSSVGHVFIALLLGDRADAGGISRLTGGTHPILLGFESLVCLVGSLYLLRRVNGTSRFLLVLLVPIAGYTLWASASKTAILLAPLCLLLLWAGLRRSALAVKITLSAVILVPLALIADLERLLDRLPGFSGDLSNLTGRTLIWERTLTIRDEYEWLGLGLNPLQAGTSVGDKLLFMTFGEPFENSLLAAFVSAGYPGLLSFVGLLLVSVWHLLNSDDGVTGICLAAVVLIVGYATINDSLIGTSILWVWLCAMPFFARDRRRNRTHVARVYAKPS